MSCPALVIPSPTCSRSENGVLVLLVALLLPQRIQRRWWWRVQGQHHPLDEALRLIRIRQIGRQTEERPLVVLTVMMDPASDDVDLIHLGLAHTRRRSAQ